MVFSELKGKVVLIVGGAQGIGAAIRQTFVGEEAIVLDADIQYQAGLTKGGDGAYETHVNVAEEASVKVLVETITAQGLIPDVFVAVAGISTMDFLVESQTADFDKVLRVNTRGVYLLCKYVVREMKAAGKQGRVILLASQAGKNGYRGMSAYVASKHAVLGLTKTLAIEVAVDGILVNAVCPGIIETEMKWRERVEGGQLRGMTAEEVAAEDRSQVPLGRTGEPADVANVVLFLASPLASYLTGQAINVTGGMTMH
ncbi:SDR family oxidoreductase [Vagococcus sp. BWB3-3]|uniref:SDR family oxidoreductase n=1 Tax=Vagococcus allomyrinae TaxID=2794353 RepID=A0A940P389_9ENTE|nr:SDR family NAD(P)-dependent oxidoreductase [Vagococcus allomyrinae]MBP1040699.1 SDR family oxidoreductase [Vagococcus allomyrinae]